MPKHLNIKISGRVQGVFFRDAAQRKAGELGISGFAQNEPDGSVYIEAEAEENDLGSFLDWCWQGSSRSRVEKVEASKDNLKNFKNFSIKY